MQPRHSQPSSPTLSRSTAPAVAATERPPEKIASKPVERQAAKGSEKAVEFCLELPGVKSVAVAGTFNGWDHKRTPMRKDSNGGWRASIPLGPGRYEYRFVADGRWVSDPKAKESVSNGFGDTNSVLVV